jgi:hypothetical protein
VNEAEVRMALRAALARLGRPDLEAEIPAPLGDPDDWLFHTLSDITRKLVQDMEAATRQVHAPARPDPRPTIDDDYSRQTWIEAHERLMAHLRRDWGARLHHHYREMLARFPLTPQERANARRLDLSDFGIEIGD